MEHSPSANNPHLTVSFIAKADQHPMRIDLFLAEQTTGYSRTYFQKLVEQKLIVCNNALVKKYSFIIKPLDQITVTFPPAPLLQSKPLTQELAISIIFEHPDFIIINKPAGLTVHCSKTTRDQPTLVDWLVHQFKELTYVGQSDRPGIVHRLDKDTSGLMIIPRNNLAHAYFGNLFANRAIKKTYLAIVHGHPEKEGVIDFSISRDPIARHKMTHRLCNGRTAATPYKVLEYFDHYSLVQATPLTGRTHQIRVHFTGLGNPLMGDAIYGTPSSIIERQALHASALSFTFSGEDFLFELPPSQDFQKALELLKKEKSFQS